MKNVFAIVTLSLAGSVLAVEPDLQAERSAQADVEAVAGPNAAGDPLPNVALSSELLYKLMKAELEFRAGEWQGPFVTMMGAAQLTRDPRLARRALDVALAAKQQDEALAAVRLWRELAPNSEDAAQYYLGFIILSNHLAEAEPVFQRRLQEAAPGRRGAVVFQIQQFLSRAKDPAAANAMLERLVVPYAGMLESHIVLSQAALARGDHAKAQEHARAAMEMTPGSELAVLTLAQATTDEQAVAALLTKFLDAHPKAREVRTARARVLVNQKQFDQARGEFLTLLKEQPENLSTLYALGILSMQLNEGPTAEKYFTRFIGVLAEHPGDERDPTRVLMLLAQLAEERADYRAALQWLEKVDGADPRGYFVAQLKRAQVTAKSGDLAGARKVLDELRADDAQEQAQVLLAQAQILRDAGQVEEAFKVLDDGAKRFPGNPDVLYDYALSAEKTGRMDIMEASLRQVIVQAPDNHHAYNALGYSLAERNIRLQEALELIEKAAKMAPEDPFIMDSLGWVQFRLGNLNRAEELLRRAYSLRSDPEIAVHLGEVLWQKGQQSDARQLWREVRSKDPKNDALRSTLVRLNQSL